MEFYIKIFVIVSVASVGWIITHFFTSRRDLKNARRQRRIEALSNSYDLLIRLGLDKGIPARENHEGELETYAREVEQAIVMIHLYGNEEQVKLTNELVQKLSDEKIYSADGLVNALRVDIRRDLGMKRVNVAPIYTRQTVIDRRNNPNKSMQSANNAAD
ncbi:hypothetical protein [Microbulbifer sp. YPW16]|uniref:hypothetical protein n=1 Tax=Microbulbifer sp. YPW16 TaxID=2904242 RepID=UPI001E56AA78|nr:hypothetical protein [Microbulbifer sp. YPW16]UHQ55804.1 hypothetical protein LVE68_02100 [Microbulbifer sp. YPW16]